MSKFAFVCLLFVVPFAAVPATAGLILAGTLDGTFLGTGSTGSGAGSITVDDSFNMSVFLTFGGLTGVATSASVSANGFFPLTLPVPSGTSGSLNGTFVIDAGVYNALRNNFGTFVVASTAFEAGEISGVVEFLAETQPNIIVPEPGTWAVVLLGLAIIGLHLRRRVA